jgi:hypothetical protein
MRVLNDEAGTNLFNEAGSEEEMRKMWSFGLIASSPLRIAAETRSTPLSATEKTALTEKGMGNVSEVLLKQKGDAKNVDLEKIRTNIDFFMDMEYVEAPRTLLRAWDLRQYPLIAHRMDLIHSVQKAVGLLEFRLVVGIFSEKSTRTVEEEKQLNDYIAEAASRGRLVAKPEEEQGYDPIREAFSVAWLKRPDRNIHDDNRSSIAATAYKEIKDGRFFDDDSAQVDLVRQSEKIKNTFKSRQ